MKILEKKTEKFRRKKFAAPLYLYFTLKFPKKITMRVSINNQKLFSKITHEQSTQRKERKIEPLKKQQNNFFLLKNYKKKSTKYDIPNQKLQD